MAQTTLPFAVEYALFGFTATQENYNGMSTSSPLVSQERESQSSTPSSSGISTTSSLGSNPVSTASPPFIDAIVLHLFNGASIADYLKARNNRHVFESYHIKIPWTSYDGLQKHVQATLDCLGAGTITTMAAVDEDPVTNARVIVSPLAVGMCSVHRYLIAVTTDKDVGVMIAPSSSRSSLLQPKQKPISPAKTSTTPNATRLSYW